MVHDGGMDNAVVKDPVLVFDGDCAFCTTCKNWAERYLRQTLASGGWDAVPFQFADLEGLDVLAGGAGRCPGSARSANCSG